MGNYTESMESRIYYDIDLEDNPEQYRQYLMEVVGAFRPLDQVLEDLLIKKGFSGDRSSCRR